MKRRWIGLFGLVALALTTATGAQPNGVAYPLRPIRMVVPWPPGQATDVTARLIAQKLSEALGQPVVLDNRPGAGGLIGTDIAAKAAPDGYTLLAASSGPISISPLVQKTTFNVERDFAPVAKLVISPYVLVTNTAFPATNAREFIALLKASPGKYAFGSSGTGASAHLITEWFNNSAGVQATHVPYKGSAAAITDVISGQVAYAFETAAATMSLVRAGRLKAYGVSMARSSAITPGIEPLTRAANLSGFDVSGWIGLMVASATPQSIVNRLSVSVDTIMRSAEAREKLTALDVDIDYRPPAEFARDLKFQHVRFSEIIKKGNIRLD